MMPHRQMKMIRTADLIPYINNARTHSEVQITQIASSIKEFGFTNPLLVDEENGIIAGHGRLLAATKLGYKEIPCIVIDDLTRLQKKALVIADNKLALNAGWDDELLVNELQSLKSEGFNTDLSGFDEAELADLLHTDIDEYPNLPDGDREPFQQMTFTLHDDQVLQVEAAVRKAKEVGGGFEATPNENSNGNALAFICEAFLNG